jgi:hypothetical protein
MTVGLFELSQAVKFIASTNNIMRIASSFIYASPPKFTFVDCAVPTGLDSVHHPFPSTYVLGDTNNSASPAWDGTLA